MNLGTAAERAMKSALDGTFIRIRLDGQLERRRVPSDYLPEKSVEAAPPPKLKKPRPSAPGYRHFTAHEDKIIIRMSRSGAYPMKEIALRLQRSLGSVTARKHALKLEGRL